MTGQIVQEIVNVIDATICQENLNLFGSIFGAQVFIFQISIYLGHYKMFRFLSTVTQSSCVNCMVQQTKLVILCQDLELQKWQDVMLFHPICINKNEDRLFTQNRYRQDIYIPLTQLLKFGQGKLSKVFSHHTEQKTVTLPLECPMSKL